MALKVLSLLLASLLLASKIDGKVHKKKFNCPPRYRPLCGSDGKTYENKCYLKREAYRLNKKISVKHDGACKSKDEKECPRFCPLHYMPVCASNGIEYSNKCFMGIAACNSGEVLKEMEKSFCAKQDEGCRRACPYNYLPVCASNGKDYNNECLMKIAACETGEKLKVVKKGLCNKTVLKLRKPKEKSAAKGCRGGCPFIYSPICASDGMTYSNECVMRYKACKRGEVLEITKNRACGDVILDDQNNRELLFDYNIIRKSNH